MPLFSTVFKETATISNISSGFRKTGIFPVNKQTLSETIFMPSVAHIEIQTETPVLLSLPEQIQVCRRKTAAQKACFFCDVPKLKDDVPQYETSGVRRTKPT